MWQLTSYELACMAVIGVVCVLSLCQPSRSRTAVAVVFAAQAAGHYWASPYIFSELYYITGAFLDLVVISVIAFMRPVTYMAIEIQRVCFASIGLNMVGWAIWLVYWPPYAYDLSYLILYLWVVWIMSRGSTKDVGESSHMDAYGPVIFDLSNPRVLPNKSDEKRA